MPNYQAMYYKLFNTITDAIEILQKVQQASEELYVSEEEPCKENEESGGHNQ